MRLNRRQLAASLATATMFPRIAMAAADSRALFWRVTVPGAPDSVLFGYVRAPAALMPDIVKDGRQFVIAAGRVATDFSQQITFPKVEIDRKALPPILPSLPPQTANTLRQVFSSFPQPVQAALPTMSAFEICFLLTSEGQTPTMPSVGGEIVDAARAQGRPLSRLLEDSEVQSAFQPPDLAALNRSLDADKIAFLLQQRDAQGPIGKYLEELYTQRRAAAIDAFTASLRAHGIPSLTTFVDESKLQTLIENRLFDYLKSGPSSFVLLPLGVLTEPHGILEWLRSKGATVAIAA